MLSDLHAEEQRILALNEALGNVSTQQSADSFMKLFHDQPPIEQSLLFDSQRWVRRVCIEGKRLPVDSEAKCNHLYQDSKRFLVKVWNPAKELICMVPA